MGVARVYSAQPVYLDTSIVTVEADLSKGLHSFGIVGLPDKAVEESKERVSVAIKNSNYGSPKHSRKRVLVSLAPATLKKEGARFDLPIALSYLLASEEAWFDPSGIVFMGELSLAGELRPVTGVLSIATKLKSLGFHTLVVPKENAREAALIDDIVVYGASTLRDVVTHFSTQEKETPLAPQMKTRLHDYLCADEHSVDLGDIRGQETAKRGLEIAAAGRHNIVLYGPPGTGKTMLARALRGILPPLSFEEAIEATSIHSVAGVLKDVVITLPPFRAPHHTSSHVAIVGGGSVPKPGEVTLAHRGVLFLDEFPEFERRVVDALREPLEDRIVSISRARGQTSFPADFILIAALNPTRDRGEVQINELDRERLKKKISGPVIDRIDMWIEVTHVPHEELIVRSDVRKESHNVRSRVERARSIQTERFGTSKKTNATMSTSDIETHAQMTDEAQTLLTSAAKNLALSPRGYHRSIKLARTIADLCEAEHIEGAHVLEALTYRPKELFG